MAILYMIVKEESGPYVKASFLNRLGLPSKKKKKKKGWVYKFYATHTLKIFKAEKEKPEILNAYPWFHEG